MRTRSVGRVFAVPLARPVLIAGPPLLSEGCGTAGAGWGRPHGLVRIKIGANGRAHASTAASQPGQPLPIRELQENADLWNTANTPHSTVNVARNRRHHRTPRRSNEEPRGSLRP